MTARLRRANAELARLYPGDSTARQPVHTFIMGAHLFSPESIPAIGAEARAALEEHAPTAEVVAKAFDLPHHLAAIVRPRVARKLEMEPIEDCRIDFEDGYGTRPDAEEDAHARTVADLVATAMERGAVSPYLGIRIKPMSRELHQRSLRTLDLFVSSLTRATRRRLPANFAITLTKVMTPAHVETVARHCDALERRLRLKQGSLALELMIETPQAVIAHDGSCAVGALVAAGRGRVRAALFGTYDYTTLSNISAAWQHMRHPACDFAREMMRTALAQTGIWLSDGATSVMPVGRRGAVHHAWKTAYDDIQHSLRNGYYQGWDLHPAQLPARYIAVYAFYLAARPAATARLRAFLDRASQATSVGDVFDDAATGQALLNFFVRGVGCGALTMEEAAEAGLAAEELESRSFLAILARRQATEIADRRPRKARK